MDILRLIAMEQLIQDLRFAARVLWKGRGFTLMAVLTMALAIGATTSTFSFIEATLLRTLPFPDSKQLVMLFQTRSENGAAPTKFRWAYPRFLVAKQNATVFEDLATFGNSSYNITGIGDPLRINGESASASYFPILRTPAMLGRVYLPEEDARPGEKPLTVLGYGLWQRLFGGREDVIGKTIGVNGVTFTIIGVMPPDFKGISGQAEIWIPNMMAPIIQYPEHLTSLQNFHNIVGRLRPGVSEAQAVAEMNVVGRRVAEPFPQPNDRAVWAATVESLERIHVDPGRRRSQLILFGAVSFVLLIACVNTASLLLSKAASRTREMSIRRALGSSRGRLVRQLLTESILLALLGGTLGMALAYWATGTMADWIPPRIPSPGTAYGPISEFVDIRINETILAFAAFISIACGMLFGLAPALYATGPIGPNQRRRRYGVFVVTEFALALTLLIGAGLMIESFARLTRVDAGFDASNVLTFYIQPPQQKYDGRKGPALLHSVLEHVSAVAGVESATVSLSTPLMAGARSAVLLIEKPELKPVTVGRHYVGPDHFKTLRIPLLRGRIFAESDTIGAPGVAIINQTAARKYWPNEDPIGKRFRFISNPPFDAGPNDSVQIIGVVGDVKYGPLEEDAGADFYTPYMQFSWWFSYVMVRTRVPPSTLVPEMRRAVAAADPNLPIDNIKTMEGRFGILNQRPRFSMVLLSIFAGLALVLAAVGIYGVTAQSVNMRTKEIGIRMALGAAPQAVSRLVITEGLRRIAIGIVFGVTAAFALTRVLQSQLYEVRATDPLVFGVTAALLIVVGLAACYFPARRAARVDPNQTLRME